MSFKVNKKEAPEIPETRKQELLSFQEKLGVSFSDLHILNTAFTHSSYANEYKSDPIEDNERLEFLGDSVLSIVVSQWLYENIGGKEGECTRIRSFVVSEDSLYLIANDLQLTKYLLMGKGEELTGGRYKKAILADCTEAVFAAVFIDKGFETARDLILRLIVPHIVDVLNNKHHKDYKTMLQEAVQKAYKIVPEYNLVTSVGPDHNQLFYFTVEFHGKKYGPASGHNKKDAEQAVAELACKDLGLI